MAFPSSFGRLREPSAAVRPGYPEELFERILAAIPPARRHRALDLGAGTAPSIRPLLPYFGELIALEPDPVLAEELGPTHPRLVLRRVSAEEFEQQPDSIDLITVGASLYRMDIPRVLAKAARWLRPAGILAIWASGPPRTPDSAQAVTRQELADRWNRFRDPRLDLAESADHARRAAAGFTILEERIIPQIVWLTPHELVGFWRSTPYASAYARERALPHAYWRDLETRYSLAWPRTKIPVDFSPWLLLARGE
jgi:SAM-dependent methyltransferase